MENQKNDNLNLLEAVVQNTEMGKNTLEQIVPMTDDTQFKAELLRQRNLYHQLNQEAHTAMEACGGTAQGQSAMAKFNTKMGISMKTLTDKSTRNLAEMLTQGSGMGVVDCVKAQKDYPNAAPGTKRLAQRLMEFEEDNRVRLEQLLYETLPGCGPGVSPRTVRWGGTLLPVRAIGRAMEWPATATTAASGRNRELLLGQWPAGCKARSRADAAAGCHNPFFVSEEKATGPRPTLGVSRQQHKTPAGSVEPAGVFIWKS